MNKQAINTYISSCCGSPAKKPPCERTKDDRKEGKFSQTGLGKWHCIKCRKKCIVKVMREKNAETSGN